MNEQVFSAIFLWTTTIGSIVAAYFVATRRRRVLWPVSLVLMMAFSLLGLAGALGTTVYLITGQTTVGTPIATIGVGLRGLASAMLLGVLFYYLLPPKAQAWLERKVGLDT